VDDVKKQIWRWRIKYRRDLQLVKTGSTGLAGLRADHQFNIKNQLDEMHMLCVLGLSVSKTMKSQLTLKNLSSPLQY